MRLAPEDDLEVLPLEARADDADHATGVLPRRRVRTALAVAAAVSIAAVLLVARARGDDPAGDARALDRLWARATAASRAADHAGTLARVLVPTGDIVTANRGLAAVRTEERHRLHALGADAADLHTADRAVTRARDAITRALALRERRARVAAAFFTAGGVGTRTEDGLERGIAASTEEVEHALERLRGRYHFDAANTVTLASPALERALGSLARVTDTRVGARLLLNVDGRLWELDPDAGPDELLRQVSYDRSVRTLLTLDDGTVLSWGANGDVQLVARFAEGPPDVGPPLGNGEPMPSRRQDAVWLTTGDTIQEVSLDGTLLAGPFHPPVDQVVAAVSTGLLTFDPQPDAQPTLGVWSPTDVVVRPIARASPLAASGDVVVTAACERANCPLAAVDVRSGTTRPITAPSDGEWRYGPAAISPDGRWLATAAYSAHVDGGLYFVDLRTLRTRLVRVKSQAEDLPVDLVWDTRSQRVFGVTERGANAVWASPSDTGVHTIHLQVAFDRVIRARDVAIVPD